MWNRRREALPWRLVAYLSANSIASSSLPFCVRPSLLQILYLTHFKFVEAEARLVAYWSANSIASVILPFFFGQPSLPQIFSLTHFKIAKRRRDWSHTCLQIVSPPPACLFVYDLPFHKFLV